MELRTMKLCLLMLGFLGGVIAQDVTNTTAGPPRKEASLSADACGAGYYGTLCNDVCLCKNGSSCDRISGHCPDGCVVGYKEPVCDECDTGFFGPYCDGICHCLDAATCDQHNGNCGSGCAVGYVGNTCQNLTGYPAVVSIGNEDVVNVGQLNTMSCTASGAPVPNITIKSIHFTMVPNSASEMDYGDERAFLATFLASNTSGVTELVCEAVNVHGASNLTVNITTVDPPVLIDAPHIVDVQADNATLIWKPWEYATDIGGFVTDIPTYMVVYRIVGQFDWLNAHTDWQPHFNLTVQDLLPDTDYEFAVRSRRDGQLGEGVPSQSAQGVTICRPPNDKGIPSNLSATVTSATTVFLQWLPPALGDLGCSLVEYLLTFQVKGSPDLNRTVVESHKLDFHLSSLQPSTEYVLYLIAKTKHSRAINHAEIEFRTPSKVPGPAENVTIAQVPSDPRRMVIMWAHPPNMNESDIKEYIVRADLIEVGTCHDVIPAAADVTFVTVKTESNKATLTDLYPYASYNVTIQALSDSYGSGGLARIMIETPEAAPEVKPPKVLVMEAGSSQLGFRWDPIPCHLSNGAIFYRYSLRLELKAKKVRRRKRSESWIANDLETNDLNVTINGLSPYTSYEFSVRGVTQAGEGPPAIVVHQTADDLPAPPAIAVLFTKATMIQMQIMTPANPRGSIKNYQIRLFSDSDSALAKTVNISRMQAFHSEANLTPFTTYKIQIRSGSLLGWGPWSQPVEAYTTDGIPAAPTIVSVNQFNHSAMTVQWRPPDEPKLIILSYMVKLDHVDKPGKPLITFETSNNYTTKLTVNGLEIENSYVVFVSAKTNKGYGSNDNFTFFMNRLQSTSPPIIVVYKQINDSAIQVQWLPPTDVTEGIMAYKVECIPLRESGDVAEVATATVETADNSTLNVILDGLGLKLAYIVRVRAKTTSGYGEADSRTFNMDDIQSSRRAVPVYTPPAPPMVLRSSMDDSDPGSIRARIVITQLKPNAEFQPRLYEVVVAESDQTENLNETKLTDYDTAKNSGRPYWIAARIPASDASLEFEIGDKQVYKGYYNGPLKADRKYSVMTRAVGDSEDVFSFLSPMAVVSQPKDNDEAFLGHCMVFGISCVLFLLIIIILLFLFWVVLALIILYQRRKRKRSKKIQSNLKMGKNDYVFAKSYCPSGEKNVEAETALTVFVQAADDDMGKTETFKKSHFFGPIPVGDLADYISTRASHPSLNFHEEFKQVSSEQMAPWDIAKKAENLKKNRYGNILPFDQNRVRLEPLPGVHDSDYINASFIDGYDKPKAYIATQGPKENTFHDFWRMAWQERVAAIVMLTALVENKKKKCDQYWPNQTRLFGDVLVTLSVTEHLADIVIRHFELKKVGTNEVHLVKHYHFADWPDLGIPPCVTSVLHLRRKVREELPAQCGPIVVHCSAGAGRAGTFIAIDAMLKQAHDDEKVFIFRFVRTMQSQRIHLVQTVDQYKFIYDTVLEALQSGDTKVMCKRLPVYFRDISRTSETEPSDLVEQFNMLNKLEQRKSCFPCPDALNDDNSGKNRNQAILPVEHSRVRLQSVYSEDNTNQQDPYINAVFCDGFKQKGHFLVTHMPLDCTIEDFWRMVVRHRSSVVIMLNDCEFIDEQILPGQYWPNDGCTQYGPYQVEVVTFEEKGMVNFRTLRVIDTRKIDFEPHSVIQLQFLDWTPSEVVPSSTSSVVSLLNMTDVLQRKYGGPITVHCTDGASRSGLFCVSHVLKEQVESGEVDVFNAVKRLRRHRPQFITSVEQYQFCYEVAVELLSFCSGNSATSGRTIAGN